MGNKHTGEVKLIVQAAQPAAQILAHARIQRTEGLVQQQDLGLHGQRTGQRDALLLTTGKLSGKAVCQMRQLHHLQQIAYPLANLGS